MMSLSAGAAEQKRNYSIGIFAWFANQRDEPISRRKCAAHYEFENQDDLRKLLIRYGAKSTRPE